MQTRHINKELLRKRVKEFGIEALAVKSKCSASLLQKLIKDDYERIPALRIIDGICFATGDNMNELFPVKSKTTA